MGVLTAGNGGADDTTGAGVEVRREISEVCEGMVATGGSAGGAELGTLAVVVEVTMACSFSILFSISATLFDGCTTVRGFAGLRRATCSIHSTRAFWHLPHVSTQGDIYHIKS